LIPLSVGYAGDSNTELIGASTYGNAADVKMLLKKGADINSKDDSGHTALICAANDLAFLNWLPRPPEAETADPVVNPPADSANSVEARSLFEWAELLFQNVIICPFAALATLK